MFIDRRMANVERYYLQPPADAFMQVPDEVLKCVVFVGRPNGSGGLKITGTAFLVSVPLAVPGVEGHSLYLVTAKHVAAKFEGKRFGIRVRLRTGKTEIVWCEVGAKWWYHPTEPNNVDAAVLSLSLDIDTGFDT